MNTVSQGAVSSNTATLRVPPRRVFQHSAWDAVLVLLAVAHGTMLLTVPGVLLIAIGLWWNSNTISHNFIHNPFFRSRTLNQIFAAYLSVLLGFPQAVWRARHLAHHAETASISRESARTNRRIRTPDPSVSSDKPTKPDPRIRWSGELIAQTILVLELWIVLCVMNSAFFLTIYLPGWMLGLALCAVQGHYEHSRGTTSCYGSVYNFLFLNDGLHIEHHARPRTHWRTLVPMESPPTDTADSTRVNVLAEALSTSSRLPRPGPSGLSDATQQHPRQTSLECEEPDSRAAGHKPLNQCRTSRWPPVLRWLDAWSLEGLERLVLRSDRLQQFLIGTHERAFASLLPELSEIHRVGIVGGGLFPRTAIVLRKLLPDAELVVIDLNRKNLEAAQHLLPDNVEQRHAAFDRHAHADFDMLVFPLSLQGDRRLLYNQPPARYLFVHDWLWHRGSRSALVSWLLLKRLNLVVR